MKFNKNVNKIRSIGYKIFETAGNWNQWVGLGLMCLADKAPLFDSCIHSSPFLIHFSEKMREPLQDVYSEDEVLAFFEDIVVFIREKNLYLTSCFIDSFEEDILFFFEQSGQWTESDGTLLADWYWQHLPMRALKCLAKQRCFLRDCHYAKNAFFEPAITWNQVVYPVDAHFENNPMRL